MRDYVTRKEGRLLAEKHADILNSYENASDTPQCVYDALAEETAKCRDEAETNYWFWLQRLVKGN